MSSGETEPSEQVPSSTSCQQEDFGPITFEHFTSTHPSISPISTYSAIDADEIDDLKPSETSSKSDAITIHCGGLTAKLHINRFLCPGIHQPCVEYEGETITPKQFTVMAAKDKQKDWKGAIKINRQPLRVLFEKQLLDFYKHPEFCSGRCVSKNNRIWVPDGQDSSPTTSALSHDFNKDLLSQSYRRQSPNDSNGNGVYDIRVKDEPQMENCGNGNVILISNSISIETPRDSAGESETPAGPVLRDSINFWSNVEKVGLFPELIADIISEIRLVEITFVNHSQQQKSLAAHKLSELVRVLGIKEKIDQRLTIKRNQMKAQTVMLSTEIEELKRRTQEQKKRKLEIKRKADIFDELIGVKKPNRPQPAEDYDSETD